MCTGVRSTVVLDARPAIEVLEQFTARNGRVVSVTDLVDGRVHVDCFGPLRCDQDDLVSALRVLSIAQRNDLDALRNI